MPSEEQAPVAAAVAAAPAEGGFVKKLLFPAYTHQDDDAGANDSAQDQQQQEPQPTDPSVAESLNTLRFSSQQSRATGPPASASSCASTYSEASTAIRDNRTILHLTYPPLKQQRKATGAAAAAAAAAGADDANRANKMNAPSSLSSSTQQQQQQQQPPSFFASTKPKQKNNAKHSPHDMLLLPPASPPKVPRVPLQNRSLSTTAVVSSDVDVHPATTHFPFLDTEDVLSEKSQETVYQDAAGIAIVPAAASNTTGNTTSPTSTRPFAARFLRNRSNATTAQDRNDNIEVTNDVDNESRGSSNSSSTSGPAVQDRSILDTMSTNSDSKGDGDNQNNDPHHQVPPPSAAAAAAAAAATPAWEEEATPAQTAFGKRLLFQRVARHPAAEEDALSTTSEQGTVINHNQRLAEMNMDTDAYDINDNDDEENRDNDLIPPCGSSTSTGLYTTPPQEEEVWDEERSNLAMPVLESGGPNNPIASAMAVVGSPVRISRPKRIDEDERQDNGLEDSTTAEANQTGHAAATGILSMAIRRLGSGFSGNNANNHQSLSRNTMSAPTTPQPYRNNSHTSAHQSPVAGSLQQQPQSWISTPRSSLHAEEGPTASFPSSFLLRSPGSSAFQNAASAKKAAAAVASNNSSSSQPQLAPRFSSWQGNAVGRHRPFDKIPEEEVAGRGKSDNEPGMRSSLTNGNGNSNLKAFQIARSCFSFDAFDTSMDEQYEFSIPNHQYYGSSAGDQQQQQQHHHHQLPQKFPYMEHTSPSRQPQTQRTAAAADVMRSRQTGGGDGLTTSASWDAGSTSNSNTHHRTAAAAFRPRLGDRSGNGGFARMMRPPASNQISSPSSRRKFNNNNNNSNVEGHSRMMTSDFSPSSKVMNQGETQQLKTPQRIEIEREDALDILACLVERGVSWKCDSLTVTGETGAQVSVGSSENAVGEKGDNSDFPPPRSQTPSVSEITTVVRELQELSLAEERLGDFHNNSEAHKKRKLALEELLRSHSYALEMQRASQSASSWLQSIDRSQSASSSPQKQTLPGKPVLGRAPDSPPSTDTTTTTGSSQQAAGEESSASENMDLLTAKALLHTAQMELKEKTELADRLNEELAQCREEIGRLKTASQAAVFRSPNRSILDESDDVSVTEAEEEEEEIDVLERSFESVASVGNDNVDTSFLREGEKDSEESRQAPASGATDLDKFKVALDDANAVIRKLHSKLKLMEDENDGDKGEFADPPLIQVPSSDNLLETQKAVSSGNKEKHTVSVHMLDGENFITDWDDLAASMPGPPDHELRSPIVASILEAWTSDRNLHESLVAWMDQILEGGDPDSVPPLTLSNLGHQVRDGFTLHVLPLLFRRPDIRVDVKSRVHRRTTYDLSVAVDSLPGRQLSQDMRRTLSGSSATNSLATTALVNNSDRGFDGTTNGHENSVTPTASAQAASSRLSYDEVTEDIASPDDAQPGIMSTLGGALGGLLTRRSKGPNQESLPPEGPPSNMEMILESPSSAGLASEIVGLAEGDDDQPYHRVVSAPPGRIGVTFVEYRGHCMVSDVNPDSPLIGWIYPSDVLIAIDELPVSGMRVRDIITVLKDRTEKQRALRVVSSHAMNEFTLNASAVVDETG